MSLLSGGVGGIIGSLKIFNSIYKDCSNFFKETKSVAKVSGKLLACALACGYPFNN